LVFKLGFVYFRFKRNAKKAGKTFEKEMVSNGIDKSTAKLLKEEYLKSSHIFRQFDYSNMFKEKEFRDVNGRKKIKTFLVK
jgi:hypothetical protein